MIDVKPVFQEAGNRDSTLIFIYEFLLEHTDQDFLDHSLLLELRKSAIGADYLPKSMVRIVEEKIHSSISALCDERLIAMRTTDGSIIMLETGFVVAQELYLQSQENAGDVANETKIPASDRIVSIGDNSAAQHNTADALDEVADKIEERPNDLELKAEERMVIVSEMRSLSSRIRSGFVRIRELQLQFGPNGILRFLLEKVGGHALKHYVDKALSALDNLIKSLS